MSKKNLISIYTWLLVIVMAVVLYFVSTSFFIFPSKFKIPFLLVIVLITVFTGILSILFKKKGKFFPVVINILLSILMFITIIFLPNIEKRIRSIFKNVKTDTMLVNVYAFNENVYDDFSRYDGSNFIVQSAVDLSNQQSAIDDIKTRLDRMNLVREADVISALETFYNNKNYLLVLNEAYVDSIEELEGYNNFSDDTKVVYSYVKEIEIEEPVDTVKDVTKDNFIIYVAGSDTRRDFLSIYGRTDVDILMSVNPVTKQIMMVGIPRDTYLPNPAQNNVYDKLTHLGNDSIYNTMKAVGDYFDIDIDHCVVVNFNSFIRIIDAIGGIDVDNPYSFNATSYSGYGYYNFAKGNIHLNGDQALSYSRERKSLSSGDFDRSQHQTIVLKAIINKLISPTILSSYNSLLDALSGQFLTDMDVDDIYKLIGMQIDDNSKWDIINYSLGGKGDMLGTASMGVSRQLYVVHLFESQVNFIQDQVDKMINNEIIEHQTLPNASDTYYIPN